MEKVIPGIILNEKYFLNTLLSASNPIIIQKLEELLLMEKVQSVTKYIF